MQSNRHSFAVCSLFFLLGSACAFSGENKVDLDGGQPSESDGAGGIDASAVGIDASAVGICGDGSLDGGEACDDGNTNSGDGCDSSCMLEDNFACPAPGHDCVQIVSCGNGRIEGSETCDDRNVVAGDGCDVECQVETGWNCPVAGIACVSAGCGDGVIAGFELCDDGNMGIGDGCDAQCNLEEGYYCPTPNTACVTTICGDGQVQGTEECDDQNLAVGDGCDPFCKREPQCSGGTCLAVCGDSVLQAPELCDDGNTQSGDGCSESCMIEQGFTCNEIALPNPAVVELPVTIRDFIPACGPGSRLADSQGGATPPYGQLDFECIAPGSAKNMVGPMLGVNGKPVRVPNSKTTSDETFSQWYISDDNYNKTLANTLTLTSIGGGAYQYNTSSFFPGTGLGFDVENCAGSPCEILYNESNGTGLQNFYFTTETRWWFQYAGNEILAFSGDDDVWVFIDNKLVVDLGGIHARENASVNLADAGTVATLGLTLGGIYEVVVFQAERHVTGSQYRLTLTNFNQAPSICTDECGDGVASANEVCDLGASNGNGDGSAYGGCTIGCTLESYCGDSVVDIAYGEICDDGLNLGGSASECAPGCQQLGARCGDSIVQIENNEQCDDGNLDGGDGCSANCKIEID